MQNKNTHFLLALVVISLIFIQFTESSAQPNPPQAVESRDFGWSLEKFKNKAEKEKKDKKDKKQKTSPNVSQNISQTSSNAGQTQSQPDNSDNNQKNNSGEKADGEETIRVETNLLINDILVVNEKGTVVPNLKPGDFIVSEDGVEQKIELFSYGENAALPRSIVLIFYNAYSPSYDIKNRLEAAQALVDKLAPQDKMAIVTTDIKLILNFTTDKDLLKKTLFNLSANPQSGLVVDKDYGTLMAVLNEMFDENDVRPIVIFQSNGGETSGLQPDEDTQPTSEFARKTFLKFHGARAYGFSDVKKSIVESGATVYSIVPMMRIVGLPKEEQLRRSQIIIKEWMRRAVGETNAGRIAEKVRKGQEQQVIDYIAWQSAMMEVAKLAGGYTEFIERPEDAKKVYSTIFAVINNRYTIGYYPINQTRDGKLRKIKIEVRGHPEYLVLGRESYFAPGLEK